MQSLIVIAACVIGTCLATADDKTKCVKYCHGVKDGDYQDCTSCSVYVTCSNNQTTVRPCPVHLKWDDSVKKCIAHSSTCKHDDDDKTKCVKDCHGVKDGDYQSCTSCYVFVTCTNNMMIVRPCPLHLEWDDKVKKCIAHSSTCKTLVGNLDQYQLNVEPVQMYQSPPLNDAGSVAGQAQRSAKEWDGVEELRRVNVPRPRHCNSTGKNCVKNCTGMKDGDYQSCHGCDVYVSCVAGLRYDDRPCAPGGLVWDDNKKRCEWKSPTCKGCYTPDKPCKGTGPCCVRDCSKLPNGDYQSCLGCDVYLSCSGGLKYDKRPCAPGGTVWDDNKKICDWYSNTCFTC